MQSVGPVNRNLAQDIFLHEKGVTSSENSLHSPESSPLSSVPVQKGSQSDAILLTYAETTLLLELFWVLHFWVLNNGSLLDSLLDPGYV